MHESTWMLVVTQPISQRSKDHTHLTLQIYFLNLIPKINFPFFYNPGAASKVESDAANNKHSCEKANSRDVQLL